MTGNFNAHLEERIVLFVDGAYWAGDKQGEAVLKHLTTEPTLPIERKFRDVEHPYRLRELNGTESHLAFLYFLNAEDVNGPASREKWQGAIELLHAALGLTSLPSKGVHEAFIDVRDLRIPPTIRT